MGKSRNRPPMAIEVICPDCGSVFDHLPHGEQKARSPEQHRRFMLMCTLAYRNWPPKHYRQFVDMDQCRKWLTAKCHESYREVRARIPVPQGMNRAQAKIFAEAMMAASGAYLFPQVEGSEVVIYAAKSVAFLNMGHIKFNALNTLVQDLILKETQLDVDAMIHDYFKKRKEEMALKAGRERAPKEVAFKEF